ncbi:hypothetical protein, partial [Staphylococcus aureus]|uniref:hypothetical protein n=1 Tax=Staphylococcus aureus TaxID=1280 RepID=UPI00289B6486
PFTLLFDETQVRGYRVVLDAHTAIPLTGQSTPVVVIRLTDGGGDARVNDKDCRKKGDYIFIDAGQEIHFLNLGNARVHFAFLVLK